MHSDDSSSPRQLPSGFVNGVRLAAAFCARFASLECFQGKWRVSDERVRVLPRQQWNLQSWVASHGGNKAANQQRVRPQLFVAHDHILQVVQHCHVNILRTARKHPNCIQHMTCRNSMVFVHHKGNTTGSLKVPSVATHVSVSTRTYHSCMPYNIPLLAAYALKCLTRNLVVYSLVLAAGFHFRDA